VGRILVYGLMQRLGIAEAVETPIADFALGLEFFAGAGGGGEVGDSDLVVIELALESERIMDIKKIESLQLQP
jgi:hypothetical protein